MQQGNVVFPVPEAMHLHQVNGIGLQFAGRITRLCQAVIAPAFAVNLGGDKYVFPNAEVRNEITEHALGATVARGRVDNGPTQLEETRQGFP